MRRSLIILLMGLAFLLVATACDDKDRAVEAKGSTDPVATASPVCEALDKLDASLDTLGDSDSLEEYRAAHETVKRDLEEVRKADAGEHAAELDAFESAVGEFEESLGSLDDAGLISGMLGLAKDAVELAAKGDALDDAIDCPGA